MRAKRIREPYTLMILDQGADKGKYRWCVMAFDVNDHQIGPMQGYEWSLDPRDRQIGRSVSLIRPKPTPPAEAAEEREVNSPKHPADMTCRNGHLLSEDNIRVWFASKRSIWIRECLACRHERQRTWWRKNHGKNYHPFNMNIRTLRSFWYNINHPNIWFPIDTRGYVPRTLIAKGLV